MNLDLAAMYGTPGAESAIEEQEKIAQAELFAKLAADNGIDLNQLGDEQIAELWDGTFGKTAGDDKDEDDKKGRRASEDDDEDDKSKKAAAEFYAVKEAQDKVAEADYLGRVMAHSFTSEMDQIKEAGRMGDAAEAVGGHLERTGRKAGNLFKSKKDIIAEEAGHKATMSATKAKRIGGGLYAGGAAVTGAGGYAATRKKESSALDVEAAELAFQKAAGAGWDVNEASERLTAVLTLGPLESEKIASASTYGEALEVRSLELLAQAGYPVEWA